jgi:MFS family permease
VSKPPLLTRDFVLASFSHLSFAIAVFLFLHFPGYLKELGAGEAQIGRIMAVNALGAMACGPIVGRLLDVHGRRNMILAGAALYTLSVGLYLTLGGIGPRVYLIRLMDGVGLITVYAGLFTFASDHVVESRRVEGLALFGVSGLVPMAVSGLMGDAILAQASYTTLFATSLVFAAGTFVLAVPLRDAQHVHEGRVASHGLRGPLTQPDLRPMWFISFSFFLAAAAIFTFLKTFVMKTGLGSVGSFFTAYSCVAVGLRVFFGRLPDRVGQLRVLGPALLAYSAGLAVLGIAHTPTAVLVAGLLCGCGHGYTYPILCSQVIGRARPSDRGSAMGIYTTTDWMAHFVGAPLAGLAIESTGYGGTFVGLGVALTVAVAAFYAWDANTARERCRCVKST